MPNLKSKIESIRSEFLEKLESVTNLKDLEAIRIEYAGKQGLVTSLFKEIKNLSVEEKREVVPILNETKQLVEDQIKNHKALIIEKQAGIAQIKKKHFDTTAYQTGLLKGHFHPYSQFVEEIENIFISMGYDILDGPYVETDFYNFTALNIPKDHPARDMHDTFWIDDEHLLRTHTSTVQIHAMQTYKPPIAAVVPGFTFRHEAVDATHDTMFMQCEGFVIDKHVTLSHLFATAKTFLRKLFNVDELDIRIRPGFFPFVEPGVEIDARCPFCKGGCSVCKKTTWIEVFPGGLIHPNVLRAGGLDPKEYSGFAFGFGLTRLAMLKYKINDIRLLLGGNMKFLDQF
jgi:phenylalanyl-tRNA synthetase alpha chain